MKIVVYSDYGYAYQSPLKFTDPSGQVVPVVAFWIAGTNGVFKFRSE